MSMFDDPQKLRYLPLRLVDEQVGMFLDNALRRLTSVDVPQSLTGFLGRDRLIHWSMGEDTEEILHALGRVGGGKAKLPVIALSRDSSFEQWTEDSAIPSWRTQHGNEFAGFYPLRLMYKLVCLAFEQPVLDTLAMCLFSQLQDKYRTSQNQKLLGKTGYEMEIHCQIINDSLSFTAEPISFQQNRLFACRTEFGVGTFSYHVPEDLVVDFTPRFVFEELRYPQ